MFAARKLFAEDDLAASAALSTFDDAPLLDEPDTEDRRLAFEAAVNDYRTGRIPMHDGDAVHAELTELLRATKAG